MEKMIMIGIKEKHSDEKSGNRFSQITIAVRRTHPSAQKKKGGLPW
jgi:hypothetical protein